VNRPLRVVLWEIVLGLILAGSVAAAIWVFATQSGVEVV
jgi:hypothetical protein